MRATVVDDAGASSSTSFNLTVSRFRFTPPTQIASDGKLVLQLEAANGQRYRIESSENLIDWTLVEKITTVNGKAEARVDVTANERFFRALPE